MNVQGCCTYEGLWGLILDFHSFWRLNNDYPYINCVVSLYKHSLISIVSLNDPHRIPLVSLNNLRRTAGAVSSPRVTHLYAKTRRPVKPIEDGVAVKELKSSYHNIGIYSQ